jgi:hypothetical protein
MARFKLEQILENRRIRNAKFNPSTGQYFTVPWVYHDGPIFVGMDASVWLYQQVSMVPAQWEDRTVHMRLGNQWMNALRLLGDLSKVPPGGLRSLAEYRNIHVVALRTEGQPKPPPINSAHWTAEWFDQCPFGMTPEYICFFGIELQPSVGYNAKKWSGMIRNVAQEASRAHVADALKKARSGVRDLFERTDIDLEAYLSDMNKLKPTLDALEAFTPNEAALAQLMYWYNDGQYADREIWVPDDDPTYMVLPNRDGTGRYDTLEACAVMKFSEPVLEAPGDSWAGVALKDFVSLQTNSDGTETYDRFSAISIRAQLEPYEMVKEHMAKSFRKLDHWIEERAQKGRQLPDDEVTNQQRLSELRATYADTRECMLTDVSIIIMHRAICADRPSSALVDMLRSSFGIRAKPLERRQIVALEHCLPTSTARLEAIGSGANPLHHMLSLSTLAFAGLSMGADVGDNGGILLGRTLPTGSLVYLDPLRAARGDAPSQSPVVAIFGRTGSGKTWLAQSMCVQAVQLGFPCIMINPKGGERYKGGGTLANLSKILGGTHVVLSEGSRDQNDFGIIDPFIQLPLWDQRERTLEIAIQYVLNACVDALSNNQQMALAADMRQQAEIIWKATTQGQEVRTCMTQVLGGVRDRDTQQVLSDLIRGSSMFRLGIAASPDQRRAPIRSDAGQFHLIEFGRALDLATADSIQAGERPTMPQRVSQAVLQLVSAIALEVLLNTENGGMFVLDEAYTLQRSEQGRKMLEDLGRQGRSQRVCTVLISQEARDLETMSNYMGRVIAFSMGNEADAASALRLMKLLATRERVEDLCSDEMMPRNDERGNPDWPALALHKDIFGRHSKIEISPTPPAYVSAFSTSTGMSSHAAPDTED